MATRDEKKVRIPLPSTSFVECEIRERLDHGDYVLSFFQNERLIKSSSLSKTRLNQDNMVDLLSEAGIEFFSFSAIFEISDLLITTIKKNFQELPMGERAIEIQRETIGEKLETKRTFKKIKEQPDLTALDKSVKSEKKADKSQKQISMEEADKLLYLFEMPYSKNGHAGVYYCQDEKYAVVLFENDKPIARKKFSNRSVNQDNLVGMINDAGIEFLSFSAIYDSAEKIEDIILHPERYSEQEDKGHIPSSDSDEPKISGESTSQFKDQELPEEEILKVELPSFDTSKYRKADDFDNFIKKLTEFVEEGHPLPVKEIDIEKADRAICIILRQKENWFIQFKYKDGSFSNVEKIKMEQDAIAKLINKNIPQISFSYLYDASEKIFLSIKKLTSKPMNEVILNVAISHFLKIIEQYEKEGDLNSAAKITEVLFKRSQKEQNAKGILLFGKKLIANLEEQKKSSKVLKFQNDLVENLLALDADSAVIFVLDALEILNKEEKYLNAANLSGLILEHFLTEEENFDNISNILMLGKRQIEYYKKARLPVVMLENALRYAHFCIALLAKYGSTANISFNEKESHRNDITFMLDAAFEVQEERKSYIELLESLEKTLRLFREAGDKVSYSKYIERYILTADTMNKKDLALTTAIDASKYLLDSIYHIKACELGNLAIKYFYELKKIIDAVDFTLDIVRGLIDLKEVESARNYLKFAEELIDKAYENNEALRIKKQLVLGDLYGKLGDKTHGKSYIQKALANIKDPKEREIIVLKYVDDLLADKAILTAQEMVNLELSRLLEDYKIADVLNFANVFIQKLKKYEENNMIFEYMRYSANLMIQTDQTNYDQLINYVNDLLNLNAVDHAAFILDQLIAVQYKQRDYTRVIDRISRFLNYLLEKTKRFDLVKKYIYQTIEAYKLMGDSEGALERLVKFQEEILNYSVDLAQNITDDILKELERSEDYRKAIEVVSRMIEKQIELGRYQDAYIFSVQNARYYESLGEIDKVIKNLEKTRDQFITSNQFEDANRMTDLILRFGKSHKQNKLIINSIKDYSKSALDRGDTETAVKFSLELAELLTEDGKEDKALEYLQMVFNNVYGADKQSATQLFKRILLLRQTKEDFDKIAKKYLEPLLQKHSDLNLIKITKETLKPSSADFIGFSEKFYDNIIQRNILSTEISNSIVDFVLSAYNEGIEGEGDRLADKYAILLLEAEQVTSASILMTNRIEKTQQPLQELIPIAFNFIKNLIDRSLIEGSRDFTDRVIKMVSADDRFGSEGKILAAKIAEKFAINVATENPDLASEYAYQASDIYRSLNDLDKIMEVYRNLAKEYSSPVRIIRVFKRGLQFFKKLKATKYESKLLIEITKYLISTRSSNALPYFQETLEKLEELGELDELLNVAKILIEDAIATDNLNLVFPYIDYICRLSTMINAEDKIGGILVFLQDFVEKEGDTKKLESIRSYIVQLNIHPKKYKKEFIALLKRRKTESKIEIDEAELRELEEEEKGFEPLPVLVESSKIIPPLIETTKEVTSKEMVETRIDEEFISTISKIDEGVSDKTKVDGLITSPEDIHAIPDLDLLIQDKKTIEEEIPSLDELPVTKSTETLEKEAFAEEKIMEIPIKESPITKKTTLSDDEISSLFSAGLSSTDMSSPLETYEEKEEIEPLEIDTDQKIPALSDKEIQTLFSPEKKKPKQVEVMTEPTYQEEKEIDEEEWEIDAFGRLWKKGSRPTSIDTSTPSKTVQKASFEKEIPSETPDLSPLEVFLQKDRKQKTDIQPIIEEEAPKEKIEPFGDKVPESISSIMSSITEDEKIEEDIYKTPEVVYEEITTDSKPEVQKQATPQVKPPDLADLFSEALSELGSISGESGGSGKDKKKKGS